MHYSIDVGFKFINNKNLSASVILQYLLSRLNLLYLPREIIPRLINRLVVSGKGRFLVHPRRNKYRRRQSLVKGILFKCAGRFY